MKKNKEKTVEELAGEIFRLVQYNQGKSFISDGLGYLSSREELFNVVRRALIHTEWTVNNMKRWLRKYGQDVP